MKKYLLPLFVLPLLAGAFISCTPEEPDPLADYDANRTGVELTINRNSWEAPADSSRVVLKITSSYLWYVDIPEEAQSWLSVSQTWGDSLQTYKIYLYAAANNTPDIRSAVVNIRSGKSKKRISVTQGVAPLVLTECSAAGAHRGRRPRFQQIL